MSHDPTLLREVCFSLLEENRIMTLATWGVEGPWATPVIYAWEAQPPTVSLYFMSRLATRHARNLMESPQAATAIHPSETRPLRGLQMEGTVELLRGREALRAMRIYLRRFPRAQGRFSARAVLKESLDLRFFRFLAQRIFVLSEEHFGWGVRVPLELAPDPVSPPKGSQ
jgi:uncharacterized protein YhbP (UPF0306 family)